MIDFVYTITLLKILYMHVLRSNKGTKKQFWGATKMIAIKQSCSNEETMIVSTISIKLILHHQTRCCPEKLEVCDDYEV